MRRSLWLRLVAHGHFTDCYLFRIIRNPVICISCDTHLLLTPTYLTRLECKSAIGSFRILLLSEENREQVELDIA